VDVSIISPAIWKRAVDLFSDEKKASRWFATPLSELDGLTPEQVIESDPKSDAVSAVLDRIDYGVFN
jgi:putative toxin-antitoxin system antitoxin component (TIGR02293 family)